MVYKKPLIIWQKWVDPFGEDIDESKWTDYENETGDFSSSLIEEEKPSRPTHKSKTIKVISSPMGLIPYSEHTASGKIFNFWVGHCNFNLSKAIIDIIEQIEGVETLDIFTRYRFRIGIGKCFEDSEVMNDITQIITQEMES